MTSVVKGKYHVIFYSQWRRLVCRPSAGLMSQTCIVITLVSRFPDSCYQLLSLKVIILFTVAVRDLSESDCLWSSDVNANAPLRVIFKPNIMDEGRIAVVNISPHRERKRTGYLLTMIYVRRSDNAISVLKTCSYNLSLLETSYCGLVVLNTIK